MKSLLLIVTLIFSYSNILAQLDTIITKRNVVYPCRIIKIDNANINTISPHGSKLKVYLPLIKSAFLNGFGQIYSDATGYSASIDSLEQVIKNRLEEINKANKLDSKIMEAKEEVKEKIVKNEKRPKFSFGIFYVPNSLDKKVIYFDYNNDRYYSTVEDYSSQIESQFSFNLHQRLYLTFNLAYNSAFIKNKKVIQQIYENPINTYNNGTESEQTLKQFTIEFGIKYYFMDLFSNKVSAFILTGIGKTFAWAKDEEKDLFPDQNTIITNNRGEYIEELNSPFLLQLGFGTEYFFNKQLSVHSDIKLYYNTVSGKYKETVKRKNYQSTEKRDVEESDIVTKVGIGLNFYF